MRKVLMTVVLFGVAAAHAQIYKCQEGGRTVFSQAPCAGDGRLLDSHRAPAPSAEAPAPPRTALPPAPPALPKPSEPVAAQPAPQRSCMSPHEIANMETSASSITVRVEERSAMLEDIRRAKKCQPLMTPEERADFVEQHRLELRPAYCNRNDMVNSPLCR